MVNRETIEAEMRGVGLDVAAVLALCGQDTELRAIVLRVLCEQVATVIALSANDLPGVEAIVERVDGTIIKGALHKMRDKLKKPAAA